VGSANVFFSFFSWLCHVDSSISSSNSSDVCEDFITKAKACDTSLLDEGQELTKGKTTAREKD